MSSLSDQIDFWTVHADRPLTKFEQMVIARPFKYCSYWRTWSRMLKPVYAGSPRGLVELNLSVVNDPKLTPEVVLEFKQMKIRNHVTSSDPRDRYSSSLPDDVLMRLREAIGSDEEVQYMLYGNIWDHIDWDRYQQSSAFTHGGGIPLAQCHVNLNETIPKWMEPVFMIQEPPVNLNSGKKGF